MSAKRTGSYFIMLETADKEPPTLVRSVKPTNIKNRFLISLMHPNTKEMVYSQVHTCKDILEAMDLAKKIQTKPEFKEVKTWYEEKKFVPAPKKGKMKLYTKEEAAKEKEEAEEKTTKAKAKAQKASKKAQKPKKVASKAKPAPKKAKKTEKGKKAKKSRK